MYTEHIATKEWPESLRSSSSRHGIVSKGFPSHMPTYVNTIAERNLNTPKVYGKKGRLAQYTQIV